MYIHSYLECCDAKERLVKENTESKSYGTEQRWMFLVPPGYRYSVEWADTLGTLGTHRQRGTFVDSVLPLL